MLPFLNGFFGANNFRTCMFLESQFLKGYLDHDKSLNMLFQLIFKLAFDLENHEFKEWSLTKVIHFCVIQGMDALYINDIDQDIVKNNYIQNIIVNWV